MQAPRSKRLVLPLVLLAASCAGGKEQSAPPKAAITRKNETEQRSLPKAERSASRSAETSTSPPLEKKPSCREFAELPALGRFAGEVSYYADSLAGNKTASGKVYDPSAFSAAHRKLRFGTLLRVTDEKTGSTTCVIVNDRGPFGKTSRVLDLSRAAAEELGIVRRGVARVKVEILRE